jgi:hypothetical protein
MDSTRSRKLEKSLAVIIASTRRLKRPVDIVTLVKHIRYAEKELKGLGTVGQTVKLSVQQLKDFLTVETLCDEVKAFVKNRFIDSVDAVKNLSQLPLDKQRILADYIRKGRISSKDVRIITTFAKRFSGKPIAEIIKDYEKSKDIRIYVVQFRLPLNFSNQIGLSKRFEKIVGKSGITKLQFEGETAVLELTTAGYKKLREVVCKRRTTLRKFVTSLIGELAEQI